MHCPLRSRAGLQTHQPPRLAAIPSSCSLPAAKERKGRKERQRTPKGPAYARTSFQATEFATERRALAVAWNQQQPTRWQNH